MADDSVQSPAQDTQATLATPPDQIPPNDIGQQTNQWPISPNLANTPNPADFSPSDLANDQPTAPVSPPPVSVAEKPLEPPVVPESPKDEAQSQSVSSEFGQSASSDNTWPDSFTPHEVVGIKMANDTPADSPQVLADSQSSAVTPTPIQPEEPVYSIPVESPPLPVLFHSSTPESPPNLPNQTTLATPPSKPITTIPEEKPSESPVSDTDINIISTNQQAPQVQSEAPNKASNIDTEKPQDQLANFKPEAPEEPQEAPLANTDSDYSSQKSFGDLLSGNTNQPASSPSAPVSFGDLIKNIELTPPVIPEAERPVEQSSQNQPSSPPPQPQPPSTSQSTQSPPSPSPVIDQNEMQKQFEEKSKARLVENRIKANQVRSLKKQAHLDKIMELAKNTKSISNTDIQRLLRVSQSTATNYLSELSGKRRLKKQGIRGGAKYSL